MKFVDLILRCKLALISSSLLLILPAAAAAQTAGTGALTGTVTDSNGAVVSDVQIKVTSDATGEVRTVESHSNGGYVVPLLAPGTYTVEFVKSGFKTAVKTGLE
ncbi:MAG TPA: carboxypeptidase-like regulatory domain-containing protein, partial [Blastocatellia bacterium]|nr:carboxypeptidase-like regulatory domain-containing protein [Blastocatellia bacterium]